MSSLRSCISCDFSEATRNGSGNIDPKYRECRRNPPVFRGRETMSIDSSRGHWPLVRNKNWCGEYRKREE